MALGKLNEAVKDYEYLLARDPSNQDIANALHGLKTTASVPAQQSETTAPPSGTLDATNRRVALVIGNSTYTHTTPLTNPRNDAELISATLRQVGFNVNIVLDADQAMMKRALVDFGRLLRGSDAIGLFYYAGHGVQVKGENYLIPVDANITDEAEIPIASVNLNEFLATMERAQSRINIAILDACRNNPFPSSGRAGTRGLARVDAPSGTYIAYATAPGQVAQDGDTSNSPYTRALASSITTPGIPIEEAFKRTRKLVQEETQSQQTPWETSSITGDFFFVPPPSGAAPSQNQLPPESQLKERDAFDAARSINTTSAWDAFLNRFPSGFYAELARAERDKHARAETAPAALHSLELAEGKAWLVITSLAGLSEAKEFAQQFAQKFGAVMVVRMTNSRYAVTLGWGTEESLAHRKQVLTTAGTIAADSTHGARFVEPVWTQENWHTLLVSDRERFLDRAAFAEPPTR